MQQILNSRGYATSTVSMGGSIGTTMPADPEMIKLYQSLSTILRNRSQAPVKSTLDTLSKPYFTAKEKGGLYSIEGLKVHLPILTNLLLAGDQWTSFNSSARFLDEKVEGALRDISKPILERVRDKWGNQIKSIVVGYREHAPFRVKVSNADYVFYSDAVACGVNFSSAIPTRLMYVLLQEGNSSHARRGLCQIQRVNGKENVLEAVFCVYPGYSYTRVFGLREKNYFNNVESTLG